MSNLPRLAQLEFETEEFQVTPHLGKSYLFDFSMNRLVIRDGSLVEIEGLDVLKQWVQMTIRTEKHRYKVYQDTEYGIVLDPLIGSNFKRVFIESELKREITESLLQHPYIDGFRDWSFERSGSRMKIIFTLLSPLGQSEVTHVV